ncbi:uncharacterized protein Z518_04628 [Rhinocladiella mackenziei CBS 650.93]|uniref:Cytochrome b5 heme-binding domain-containing protein n=1 Tax=Rhinocladiella mackenziei CBS 650.93 TaxID=1442369 RepID=A0A0D2FWN4_9EURO|nr:uncharacterized protein Z518_04628 [Rhinocladiella mackenziei CBS 650.93]KIX06652.1 hypothetical protein Z518_04628 [Rhinocladiella mackenziei CBS 650.93]
MASNQLRVLTSEDLASHRQKEDLYVVVHNKVYNISPFVTEHPGGEDALLDVAGTDATEAFEDVGHSDEARALLKGFLVGEFKQTSPKESVRTASHHTPMQGDRSVLSSRLYLPLLVVLVLIAVLYLR